MLVLAAKRLLLALVVAFTVSVLSFALLRLSGDLAQALAGPTATPADVERIRHLYGLDRPVVIQYLDWLRAALHGDFGRSVFFDENVSTLIATRIPVTMTLGAAALVLALLVGLPLGILAAVRPGTLLDRMALTFAVFGQALPSFWFALMLIIVFGVRLRWLPISGSETWRNFVLPSVALAVYALPAIMRLTRTGMLDVMSADFIRTARAKGVPSGRIILVHALRNAIMPVISVAAVQFGFMLGGSVVIESVFAMHGLGYLGWESIQRADFPVVQGVVLVLAAVFVLLTFAADVINAAVDPRVRSAQ